MWAGVLMLLGAGAVGADQAWQVWGTNAPAQAWARTAVAEYGHGQGAPVGNRVDVTGLRTGDVPVMPAGAHGQMSGILIVAAWYGKTDNAMPILEGTDASVLDRAAAGHYTGTATVGQIGNFALAGHRRTHGNSFFYLPDLHAGDQVVVETTSTWYVYTVTSAELVAPTDIGVLAPVSGHPGLAPSQAAMTLTTCDDPVLGAFGNSMRWVTHAALVGWRPRSAGLPPGVRTDPIGA